MAAPPGLLDTVSLCYQVPLTQPPLIGALIGEEHERVVKPPVRMIENVSPSDADVAVMV